MDRLTDLDAVLDRVWTRLARAAEQPGHPLRALTFGTAGPDGPHLRTVILRGADPDAHRLAFHSDRRSQKVADLRDNDRISWLAWDPDTREQVRLHGTGTVHLDDDVADRLWAAEAPASLDIYVCPPAPGTPLNAPDDGLDDAVKTGSVTREDVAPGRQHFAVIRTVIDEVEWLHLHREGHYRACFTRDPDGGAFTGTWIVP